MRPQMTRDFLLLPWSGDTCIASCLRLTWRGDERSPGSATAAGEQIDRSKGG